MEKCQWCGENCKGYGMVVLHVKEEEPSQKICSDCFNGYMAEMLEVEDYEDYEQELIFKDCDGIDHCFQINKKIFPTGIFWEAVELLDENNVGYLFKTHQDHDEDSKVALKRLYAKIEKGLSKKFIVKKSSCGHEYNSLIDDKADGRIEWDDNYDGHIPRFIIDGKGYSLEELGKMLMTYEGWNFKLEVIEPTE